MATNYAKASYTEVIDLQTTNGQTTVVGIHTPVGRNPYERLHGFFTQFKKFRYRGISSLTMVPAANLPVDPLGLTGVPGTTDLMDPRDALNPILFHGAHGTSLNNILNTIYSGSYVDGQGIETRYSANDDCSASTDKYEIPNELTSDLIQDYYRCLTDTTWKKFGIQNGVRLKRLHPLVHKMARNLALLPAGISEFSSGNTYETNAGLLTKTNSNDANTSPQNMVNIASGLSTGQTNVPVGQVPVVNEWKGLTEANPHPAYTQEFTNGMTSLGWLPTVTMTQNTTARIRPTGLPKLFMGVLVLPPSYNVEQFFRLVLRHEFEFGGFTTSLGPMGWGANSGVSAVDTSQSDYYNWIDYSDPEQTKVAAEYEGVDDVGSTLDIIGGSSDVISDGVS